MLVAIKSSGLRDITAIPHKTDYDRWRKGLTDARYDAIMDEIGNRVGAKEISVASFLPGKDWTGTPFQPIYESACGRDFDASRKFFRLLVWEWMMEDDNTWSFGRYDTKMNPDVEGMTYFQVTR